MSCPCTSKAVSTSAALSATSSFTLLLFPEKRFLTLSAKRSSQITSLVTPAGNSHFAMARPPGQCANIYIQWSGTSDETHQCLRQSSCLCHHLPGPSTSSPLTPVRLRYAGLSYPHIAMAPAVGYCTGAGKLLGSLMSWGRDGGLSTDSSATTVEIAWMSFAIPRVPPFPSLPPSLYFVSVDKSLNAAFKKTTVAKH